MADVTAFIQALQQNLIEPLQKLPVAQLKALDTTHNQSVVDFQNAIGQLYAPPGLFTGKASGALADLLSDYYAAESALTAYMSNGLSEHISKLIQFCQQVVSDLPPQLKDLQGTDPTMRAGQVLLSAEAAETLGPDETPAAPIVQLVTIAIVGTVFMVAQGVQEWKVWNAYDTRHTWEMNMNGLAAQAESSLPTSPSQITADVNVDLPAILAAQSFPMNLTSTQRRQAKELAEEYGVDEQLIRDLMAQGYTADEIEMILRVLKQNARTDNRAKQVRYMNRQLLALIQRYAALTPEQRQALAALGYTPADIRLLVFANQVSAADLIQRAQQLSPSTLKLLHQAGYSDEEIRRMLLAGMTEANLRVIGYRTLQALKNGVDQYGLSAAQLHTLMDNITSALLSGDTAKITEGQVARCILDRVTIFQVTFPAQGPGLKPGEIDVGTTNANIEVKQSGVDSVDTIQLHNLAASFPGKMALYYAPSLSNAAQNSALSSGAGMVVGNCQELNAALR